MGKLVLDEEAKRMFESQIPRGKMGRPVELSVDGGLSAI
jgi:hypothetical protein